ncbi:MAG: hypothetical protein KGH94_04480 [Candidatus Micrarchaeota archaeon]|nr:hypothetical protein [Candidatus Micrarchaeota archaeon]
MSHGTKTQSSAIVGLAGALAAVLTVAAYLLAGMPYAASLTATQAPGVAAVNAAVARTSCQVTFVQDYLSGISSRVPSIATSVAAYSTSLAQLNSELQAYSGTGNIATVQSFMLTKANPLFTWIKTNLSTQLGAFEVAQGRENYINALTPVVANYSGLVWNYSSCSLAPDRSLAEAKLQIYELGIAEAQRYAANLSSYGINTSSLDTIISGANASVIGPLTVVVTNSTSSSQLESLIGSYCLYDGCSYHLSDFQGVNYHLAARMRTQGAQLILDKIRSSDRNANASQLAEAQSHISNASAILQKVNLEVFTGSQGAEIAKNLSEASILIKESVGVTTGGG